MKFYEGAGPQAGAPLASRKRGGADLSLSQQGMASAGSCPEESGGVRLASLRAGGAGAQSGSPLHGHPAFTDQPQPRS